MAFSQPARVRHHFPGDCYLVPPSHQKLIIPVLRLRARHHPGSSPHVRRNRGPLAKTSRRGESFGSQVKRARVSMIYRATALSPPLFGVLSVIIHGGFSIANDSENHDCLLRFVYKIVVLHARRSATKVKKKTLDFDNNAFWNSSMNTAVRPL